MILLDLLLSQIKEYKNQLSCIMITYPSTNGVFEETVVEICDMIHTNGGQVSNIKEISSAR